MLGNGIKMTQESYYELMAGEKERAVSMLPKIDVAAKLKPGKKSGKEKTQKSELPALAQLKPEQPAPSLETIPQNKTAKVISIDGFKKRMLVNAVGQ